ncbi:hypothetical protein [Pseudoalteromonas sp. MTN2-4]|uniref:hypothetical protein n=1 Tax=Pseudoalteromonas sp. MTN2-4 TaxID=3056555 RepID=UPI0036F2BA08
MKPYNRASPDWLETDALLLMFAKNRKKVIKKYMEFVAQGRGVAVWHNQKKQVFMGDEDFVERHQAMLEYDVNIMLSEVPKKQINIQSISFLKDKYRDDKLAMTSTYLNGRNTMTEIAAGFGVHYSTVSRAVAKKQDATHLLQKYDYTVEYSYANNKNKYFIVS